MNIPARRPGTCAACGERWQPAALLAAAAIVAVEAEERGLRHWVDLADRLTREAALRAAPREDEDDE